MGFRSAPTLYARSLVTVCHDRPCSELCCLYGLDLFLFGLRYVDKTNRPSSRESCHHGASSDCRRRESLRLSGMVYALSCSMLHKLGQAISRGRSSPSRELGTRGANMPLLDKSLCKGEFGRPGKACDPGPEVAGKQGTCGLWTSCPPPPHNSR